MVTVHRPVPLTTRPSVSVVVPCYNYGRYLPDVVGSVLAQPGVEAEVIIVDDCSPDGSGEVARRLAAAGSRVRLIEHATNRGHIATYNDGLAAAGGDYVVLLSADDLLSPGSLSRSVALLEAHPQVALVYGHCLEFSAEVPQARTEATSWTVWKGDAWVRRLCRRGNNVIHNPEVVLRGAVMADLVGYDARLPHSADMHLWLRAALRGDVARINGADQAFYRVHGANMHLTDQAGFMVDLTERQRAFDLLLEDPAAARLDVPRLRRRARTSIAREALRLACEFHDTAGAGSAAPDPAPFADLALRCDPAVTRSWAWFAYRSRVRRGVPGWWRAGSGAVREVRNAVRWRLWRRFGI